MRPRSYDPDAADRSVSVMLNGDLCAKAEAAGIDLSRVAEQAILDAFKAHVRAEIEQEMAWVDAYEAEHGSFARHMRDYTEEQEANGSV